MSDRSVLSLGTQAKIPQTIDDEPVHWIWLEDAMFADSIGLIDGYVERILSRIKDKHIICNDEQNSKTC